MKYLSAREASQKWGISSFRVRTLAGNGRIKGAQFVGNSWMIPEDAEKPFDGRTKESKKVSRNYRFPLMFICNYTEEETNGFSWDEKILLEAQRCYCNCEMTKAKVILEELLTKEISIYVKIGTLYFLCYTYLHTRDFRKIDSSLLTLRLIFETEFDNKIELKFILEELMSVFNNANTNNTTGIIDFSYKYSKQAQPYILVLETCRQLTKSITQKTSINPNLFEFICKQLEDEHFFVPAMYMHHYIGTIYQYNKYQNKAKEHFLQAIKIAIQTKCFAPLLGISFANFELYESIMIEFSEYEYKKSLKYHRIFVEDYALYLEQAGRKSYYKNISDEDFKYINYVLLGMLNKNISQKEGISESTVNKKLMNIYEKLNVFGKKELQNLVISAILDKQ